MAVEDCTTTRFERRRFASPRNRLGERDAARRIITAVERITARGLGSVPGRDKTETITKGVLAALG